MSVISTPTRRLVLGSALAAVAGAALAVTWIVDWGDDGDWWSGDARVAAFAVVYCVLLRAGAGLGASLAPWEVERRATGAIASVVARSIVLRVLVAAVLAVGLAISQGNLLSVPYLIVVGAWLVVTSVISVLGIRITGTAILTA